MLCQMDSSPSLHDTKLVERIKQGDLNAYEEVFNSYYADLIGFILRYVKSKSAAEEVVQNVFLWIWENKERWEVTYTLKAYLYGAVRNRAISSLRRKEHEELWAEEQFDTIEHTSLSLDDELHTKDFSTAVEQAIATLPERCRLIFTLHREEGLTYTEIASMLNISISTVETQMGRALKTLRKLLADYLPFLSAFAFLHDTLK